MKKTQEFGEVKYRLAFRLEYGETTRNDATLTKSQVVKEVELDVGHYDSGCGLSIGAIVAFQQGSNELLQLVKNLLANGTDRKLTLTKSAYEDVPEYTTVDELGEHKLTIKQLECLVWTFADSTFDFDPDEEGAGLYLRPDPKSDTPDHWDGILYWGKDIFESLKEMHL